MNLQEPGNKLRGCENMDEMSGIIVEHVYKSFGMEQILTDVSMKVLPGKIFGIVGNNGSGKTVLMKCICGFFL